MNKKITIVSDEEEYEWEKRLVRESEEEELRNGGVRKGQWTPEEDSKLSDYIAIHGLSNWNSIASLAGLKRSGKSCRLRWLNYLRPDLRRGNFTLEEKLLILQLHFRWGNRWSKIAQELPGRTDNEIKNYWRTKVQKLAKQFNCNANSLQFRNALLHTWMPRLMEQIRVGQSPQSNPTIGPIHESLPELGDLYYKPSMSNFGCLCDFQTSVDPVTTRAVDLHVGPTTLLDPYETHMSPDLGLSGRTLDSSLTSTWELMNDSIWDLPVLSDEDLHFITS